RRPWRGCRVCPPGRRRRPGGSPGGCRGSPRGTPRPASGSAGWCRRRRPAGPRRPGRAERSGRCGPCWTAWSYAAPGDGDGHVVERHGERRLPLLDAELALPYHLVLQADLCDALGEGLDEVDGLALDDGHDLLRHDAVVHGLRQVVVGRGRPGVQPEDEVHEEGLALLAFLGEHTVVPTGPQA